jgi:Holliday junction resolvase
MSGKPSRDKGRRGEREAKALLADCDYTILADTTAGLDTDDLVALAPDGTLYSVEVKNTRIVNVPVFRDQARKNAKKMRGCSFVG